MSRSPTTLVRTHTLDATQLAEAEALARSCNQADGLFLKLNLPQPWCSLAECSFLAYKGSQLVGYCGIEGGPQSIEICGMVEPFHRRHGVGGSLLSAALDSARTSGVHSALLICEEASPGGLGFAAAAGYSLEFREHHMRATALQAMAAPGTRLRLRVAEMEDVNAIAAITAAAFGDPEDRLRATLPRELSEGSAVYYVGVIGKKPVSALKVYYGSGEAGIYAFGVDPKKRRHGYGRATLQQVMDVAAQRGHPTCYLEVESANHAALALYQSVGFHIATTYGYYRISL